LPSCKTGGHGCSLPASYRIAQATAKCAGTAWQFDALNTRAAQCGLTAGIIDDVGLFAAGVVLRLRFPCKALGGMDTWVQFSLLEFVPPTDGWAADFASPSGNFCGVAKFSHVLNIASSNLLNFERIIFSYSLLCIDKYI
jgi:hypothetical protein